MIFAIGTKKKNIWQNIFATQRLSSIPVTLFYTKAINTTATKNYRVPFVKLVVSISSFVCAVRAALGEFCRSIYDMFNMLMANPMRFLSLAPRALEHTEQVPEKYDADGYRAVIGEPSSVSCSWGSMWDRYIINGIIATPKSCTYCTIWSTVNGW